MALTLLDNDDFVITMGFLGFIRVTAKTRNQTRTASIALAQHLKMTMAELQKVGYPITSSETTFLLDQFAEAVWGPAGGPRQRVFLGHSPGELVRALSGRD